jgi:hypothetical protein
MLFLRNTLLCGRWHIMQKTCIGLTAINSRAATKWAGKNFFLQYKPIG